MRALRFLLCTTGIERNIGKKTTTLNRHTHDDTKKWIIPEVSLLSNPPILMHFLMLSYVSDAVMAFRESDLDTLRHTCRVNNAKSDVTGRLIYAKNMFLQVLEGESTVILDLFGRIENDERHKNVVIMDKVFHTNRVFDSWLMGYPRSDAERIADGQEGYVELFDKHDLVIDTQSIQPASVAFLLNAFKLVVNTKEENGLGET